MSFLQITGLHCGVRGALLVGQPEPFPTCTIELEMLDGNDNSLSVRTLKLEPAEVEVKMDNVMPAFWAQYQNTPCRSLGRHERVPGRTLYCYAQHYLGATVSTTTTISGISITTYLQANGALSRRW